MLVAFAISVAVMAFLGVYVVRAIDEFGNSRTDNMEWTMSQSEVEYLRYRGAIADAEAGRVPLDLLRRRFDVFYSRIDTLAYGDTFFELRQDPNYAADLQMVRDHLAETVLLIDGPDAALQAALPGLYRASSEINDAVRDLTVISVASNAESAVSQRAEILRTLVKLAVILALMFAALLVLAAGLMHLNRRLKQQTSEIRSTAERTKAIADTALDGIVVCDSSGTIVELNPAALRLFGLPYGTPIERKLNEFLCQRDDRRPLAFIDDGVRPDPAARRFETEVCADDGRRFPVEIAIDSAGHDLFDPIYVAYIRDISRQKAAEDALTEARDRALAGERAKARFLAVMSHEMRTPLNGLLGTLQLMRDTGLSEPQDDLLDRTERSGEMLVALVDDVLDLSKFEAGKLDTLPEPVSIDALMASVIETAQPLALANGNVMGWTWIGPPEDHVMADARLLRQVLLNLVSNAVKFTRDGSVQVEVERLQGKDGQLEFRVIDTGIGIEAADLDRIFEDFERIDSSYARAAGGTGLGLGIARRYTLLMDGDIGAESEPGDGSLFWLRLPLARVDGDMVSADAPQSAEAPVAPRPLSVLLVEDNEINRFVARRMLEADGHRVTEAGDGAAGVAAAEAERFDAILMDISMPVMDGQEAARRIRAGSGPSSDAPIIAVTAHALPDEVARFRSAGMQHCIGKPVDRGLLHRILGRVAQERKGPGQPPRRALFDPEHLMSMRNSLPAEIYDALIARFRNETTRAIAVLNDPETPPEEVATTAHQLSGSAAAFGAEALRADLARIETDAKAGRRIQRELRERLALNWRRTDKALSEWRPERTAAE
ncbi:hybrid sensor histidine kinase/response regulator [Litorisediminicola beolgyonensis]|uniref:histidine kinase n=1 Tax=Litorisediminicola beolgyonensis TaxID=1173614 RepID=A0ABW3ZLV3_9RHOB